MDIKRNGRRYRVLVLKNITQDYLENFMKYERERNITPSKKKQPHMPSYEAFVQWHEQEKDGPEAKRAATAKQFLENFEEFIIYDSTKNNIESAIMAINKPPYITAHGNGIKPPYGVSELAKLATGNPRLTTIHRLDRDTTGVLLLGKTKEAITELGNQFARTNGIKEVQKTYLALVDGYWNEKVAGVVIPIAKTDMAPKVIFPHKTADADLASIAKNSATGMKIVGSFVDNENNPFTLLQLQLFTGRIHQIRLATSHLGNPISGDPRYNDKATATDRQLLHAYELSIREPGTTRTEDQRLHFHAPLPTDFQEKLASMKYHQITEPSLSHLLKKR